MTKGLLYLVAAAVILVGGFMAVANNAASQMPSVQQTASNQPATTACGGVGRGGDACGIAQ